MVDKPKSAAVEAIHSLKFSLALSDPDSKVKVVQVTSSLPSEGKTSLALSLARVEAASGKKVVLIDGDLRRSSIGKKLGIKPGHKGLSDLVIAGSPDLSEFLVRDEEGKVDFMPTGTAKYANATDIFSSHRMQEIIDLLKELKIDDNTIMFFTSDNGAAKRFEGVHNSCGIMKGNKRSMHEGGIRVPMVARWPGKIKAGSESDLPWYFPDVMATLCDLAGISEKVPENTDGISVLPTLMKYGHLLQQSLVQSVFSGPFPHSKKH